jgi:hypothetical protein
MTQENPEQMHSFGGGACFWKISATRPLRRTFVFLDASNAVHPLARKTQNDQ